MGTLAQMNEPIPRYSNSLNLQIILDTLALIDVCNLNLDLNVFRAYFRRIHIYLVCVEIRSSLGVDQQGVALVAKISTASQSVLFSEMIHLHSIPHLKINNLSKFFAEKCTSHTRSLLDVRVCSFAKETDRFT